MWWLATQNLRKLDIFNGSTARFVVFEGQGLFVVTRSASPMIQNDTSAEPCAVLPLFEVLWFQLFQQEIFQVSQFEVIKFDHGILLVKHIGSLMQLVPD